MLVCPAFPGCGKNDLIFAKACLESAADLLRTGWAGSALLVPKLSIPPAHAAMKQMCAGPTAAPG